MNSVFAESTTSVAFVLTLSKRACNTLLRLHESKGRDDVNDPAYIGVVSVDSLKPLLARGLVFWHQDDAGRPNGFGGMTRAGQIVADLLLEAGMTIENTNTPMVTRRIERSAA